MSAFKVTWASRAWEVFLHIAERHTMFNGKSKFLALLFLFAGAHINGACGDIFGPLVCPKLVLFSQLENSARHIAGEIAYKAREPDNFGWYEEPFFTFNSDLAFEYQHSFNRDDDLFNVDINNIILEPYFYTEIGWKNQSRSHWGKGGVIWIDFTIPFVHTSLELDTTVTTSTGGRHERCCFKANGVADLPLQLGYTFLRGHKGQLSAFARFVAPTGKLTKTCPYTETLIGYDRWQFGGGMWGHIRVYEKNSDAAITFYGSFYATHLFDKHVNDFVPVFSGNGEHFELHHHVNSKINWQLNALLFADIMYKQVNWSFGYEFKGRDREKFNCGEFCDAPQIFANKAWSNVSYYWDCMFPATAGIGVEVDIGQGRHTPSFWGLWLKGTVEF